MGTKRGRAMVVCTMLALGCVAWVLASGGTTEVRVYDPQGQLVQNGSMIVVNEAGDALKVLARPDGVFEIDAVVGQKVEIFFAAQTIGDTGAKFNQIVPASEEISLSLGVDAPSNDLCEDAIAVAIPSVTAGTTLAATLDGTDAPTCVTSTTAPGVWYTVVGNGNTLRATTCPSLNAGASADYDTKISVYCLDCDTPTCVTGNDDVTCSVTFRSAVTWCSQAGATYRIFVHGFSAATGNFNLAVDDMGTSCTSTIQCLPTGACCTCLNPPFDCSVTDLNSCLALGGIPRGAGIGCFTLVDSGPQVYEAFPNLALADPGTVTHSITVPTSYTVGDVNIDLGITHTWISDLDIRITHNGKTQTIWDNRCGSTDNINATADDEGTETLCAVINAGPIDGVFYSPVVAGLGPLSIFDGQDAAGVWTLSIQDVFATDTGTLNQWSLHITEGNPTCDLNVAVCHYADGQDPHTLIVGQSSVTHHLDHGDTIGPCAGDGGGTDGSFGRHP